MQTKLNWLLQRSCTALLPLDELCWCLCAGVCAAHENPCNPPAARNRGGLHGMAAFGLSLYDLIECEHLQAYVHNMAPHQNTSCNTQLLLRHTKFNEAVARKTWQLAQAKRIQQRILGPTDMDRVT